METKHLHAILQEIGSNLTCKQCGIKLDISSIKLLKQNENAAHFEIQCNKCSSTMQISAEITKEKKTIDIPNIPDEKSLIVPWNISDTIITQNEINRSHKILKNISSFKDLFGVFLIISLVMFGGCTDQDLLKEDIKNKINDVGQNSIDFYEKGKEDLNGAIEIINKAPEQINNAINDVKTLKKEAEDTLQKTQEAIDKINDASQAAKDAMQALDEISN